MITEKDLLNKFVELLQEGLNAYALFDSPANQEQLRKSKTESRKTVSNSKIKIIQFQKESRS